MKRRFDDDDTIQRNQVTAASLTSSVMPAPVSRENRGVIGFAFGHPDAWRCPSNQFTRGMFLEAVTRPWKELTEMGCC